MSLFNLDNKVAIVTGASRGIGRSIAIQLGRAGAKVVVSSRKLDACEMVVKEIQKEGGTAMAISASIAVKLQLEQLVSKTREAWGPIDVLVCNAASNPYYGPMTGMSDEVFNKIMHNNVLSSAWLCNMVYPDMKAQKKWGHRFGLFRRGLTWLLCDWCLQHLQSSRHATGPQPGS